MQNLRDELSVVDYLQSKGYVFKRKGRNYLTNSPYNPSDKTPSFCVFPDGAFKDFSTGKAGNIITLVRHFKDNPNALTIQSTWVPPKEFTKKPWNGIPDKFLLKGEEWLPVWEYAKKRGIVSGFEAGCFYTKSEHGFDKHLAILFPHQNNGIITGAKFRAINPVDGQRFSVSGQLGFYMLENRIDSFEPPTFYLVEGEANANSLWEYCKQTKRNAIIASAGGVTSIPKTSPKGKLIIDYDNSDSEYISRIKNYEHLGLEPVKLMLPKGEDINSMWVKGELGLIDSIL